MATIKVTIEIEGLEDDKTSVKIVQPGRVGVSGHNRSAITSRLSRFINELGDNELQVLREVIKAKQENRKIFRKEMMSKLQFDKLLQLNGVLAWITRKYRKLIGDPDSCLVETVWDNDEHDYSIEIQPEVFQDVIQELTNRIINENN